MRHDARPQARGDLTDAECDQIRNATRNEHEAMVAMYGVGSGRPGFAEAERAYIRAILRTAAPPRRKREYDALMQIVREEG